MPVTVVQSSASNASLSTLESIIDGFGVDDVWNQGFLEGKLLGKQLEFSNPKLCVGFLGSLNLVCVVSLASKKWDRMLLLGAFCPVKMAVLLPFDGVFCRLCIKNHLSKKMGSRA